MKRIALIANPRAGRYRGLALAEALASRLRVGGATADIHATLGPGDGTRLAAELASDHDILVAVGGDGSLRELVEGLPEENPPDVGLLPVGTANVIAREFGIPRRNLDAQAAILLGDHRRRLDLGRVNGAPFLANVGVGFDAEVVQELDRRRRLLPEGRSISMLSYLPIGFGMLAHRAAPRLRVSLDGEGLDEDFSEVIVCNTRNYGGVMAVCPTADPGDGELDVILRRRRSRLATLPHLASSLLPWEDPRSMLRRARRIRIESEIPAAAQADGDPRGETPLEIELDGRGLEILVPEGASR